MSDEFKAGARAMFDYITFAVANHYHVRPGAKEQCEIESAYANDVAERALEEVSPEDHAEWLKIGELQAEITQLKQERVCKQQIVMDNRGFNKMIKRPCDEKILIWLEPKYCDNCGGKIEIEEGR